MPDYLAAVLRSSLVVAQTMHLMTGNALPRLASEDVANLVIPLPPVELQKNVVAEVVRRRMSARQLRDDATTAWTTAKTHFEESLLGPIANK